MATGKQNCRMGQKGLPPGPGEVNLVSGTRGFTSEGQRWPTTLPAPTALTMSAEDTLPGKCLLLWGTRRGAWSPRRGSEQRKRGKRLLGAGLCLEKYLFWL